jgi:nucleotide-binding universal stress UspA family protein
MAARTVGSHWTRRLFAHREETCIHGLFVLGHDEEKDSTSTQEIQHEFTHRCQAAGVGCDLMLKSGEITENICEAARWNDLVVINLTYPPEAALLARLSSGIRNLIRRCSRPLLFTPQVIKPFNHALLAYDGSTKAKEAIYLSAYLVNKWKIPLHVISIGDEANLVIIQAEASQYMEDHGVHAEYISSNKDQNISAILASIEKYDVDLLLIGGYSRNPIMELVQENEVDELLRQLHIPVLICR